MNQEHLNELQELVRLTSELLQRLQHFCDSRPFRGLADAEASVRVAFLLLQDIFRSNS